MAGINSIKVLLTFIFTAASEAFQLDKNKDGQLSFSEIFASFTALSFQFPDLIEAFPEIKAEWQDLDENEQLELVAYFETLDLPDEVDNIEEVVRLFVNWAHYNYRFYLKVKGLLAPADAE